MGINRGYKGPVLDELWVPVVGREAQSSGRWFKLLLSIRQLPDAHADQGNESIYTAPVILRAPLIVTGI